MLVCLGVIPGHAECGGDAPLASPSARAALPLSVAEECALKPTDLFKKCDR